MESQVLQLNFVVWPCDCGQDITMARLWDCLNGCAAGAAICTRPKQRSKVFARCTHDWPLVNMQISECFQVFLLLETMNISEIVHGARHVTSCSLSQRSHDCCSTRACCTRDISTQLHPREHSRSTRVLSTRLGCGPSARTYKIKTPPFGISSVRCYVCFSLSFVDMFIAWW